MVKFFSEDKDEKFERLLQQYLEHDGNVDDVFNGEQAGKYGFIKKVTFAWLAALDVHPKCPKVYLQKVANPLYANEEGYTVLDKTAENALINGRMDMMAAIGDFVKKDELDAAKANLVTIEMSKMTADHAPPSVARSFASRAWAGGLRNDELTDGMSYGKNNTMVMDCLNTVFDIPKVIAYQEFRKFGEIPRSSPGMRIPISEILGDHIKVVFVSHRWLTPNASPLYPDNEEKIKFNAIVKGVSNLASNEGFDLNKNFCLD